MTKVKSEYNEPKFERYKKAILSNKDKIKREALYEEQKRLEKRYGKQQAQITLGSRPSQREYRTQEVLKNLRNKLYKMGQQKMVSRRILKQSHPTLVIQAHKDIPYKSSYFNGTRGIE